MKVIPERLKELRERRSWSRAQLAQKTEPPRLNTRTIQRLEEKSGQQESTRESTVLKLANALEVEPGVLTGALPLPDPERLAEILRQRFTVEISSAARNSYELIKIQYGVQPTTLVEMAPLFFVLLAEASLADRRKKLEELKTAVARLMEIAQGHLVFAYPSRMDSSSGPEDEEHSIAQKDLFGAKITDEVDDFGYSDERDNPFASFLRKLAETLNDPYQARVSDTENTCADDLPDYSVCLKLLRQLACEDNELTTALMAGFVQLSEMPARLRGDDVAGERLEWLRERYATWQARRAEESTNLPPLWERLGLPPELIANKENHDDPRRND